MTVFVSRDEWGARAPRSISTNITPKGVAIHWGGTAVNAEPHNRCAQIVRNWQNYHMDSLGWSDLAYTLVCCPHDHVFAGRGAGIRTAANGTNDGNQHYYAACGLIGGDETPTEGMLDAFGWSVRELRKSGAGDEIVPHHFFKPTQCPGPLANSIGEIAERAETTKDWLTMATKDEVRQIVREELGRTWDTQLPRDRQEPAITGPSYRWIVDAVLSGVQAQLDNMNREGPATLSDADVERIVDRFVERLAS